MSTTRPPPGAAAPAAAATPDRVAGRAPADPSLRRLKLAYVLGLMIIGLLSLGTHITIDRILEEERVTAHVVNLTGRQRVLSQTIARLTSLYVDAGRHGETAQMVRDTRDRLRADIFRHMAMLERVHSGLQRGDPRLGLPAPMGPDLQEVLFEAPHTLDNRMVGFLTDLSALLLMPDPRVDETLQQFQAVQAAATGPLLQALDQAVAAIQTQSERRVDARQRQLWGILAIILVTLVLEAVLLFRPIIRRVQHYQGVLHDLAHTDGLTGCFNRRTILQIAMTEFVRARRFQRPMSLLIVDLDRFKRVNDTYGHAAGDRVIQTLAQVTREVLRAQDSFGRLGGEEFVVVLPETGRAGASALGDRILQRLRTTPIPWEGAVLSVTASLGAATLSTNDTAMEDCLDRADRNLYAAKRGGRDRMVGDGDPDGPAPPVPDPTVLEKPPTPAPGEPHR